MTETPTSLIDKRLADLREANDVFRSHSWDRSSVIARNEREISWLRDLRSVLTSDLAQRPAEPEGIQWRRVNDEPYEYAIQQGLFGDEFVKLYSGPCLRRALSDTSTVWTEQDLAEAKVEAKELSDYFNSECQCEYPLIKCDNRGCNCTTCGLPERRPRLSPYTSDSSPDRPDTRPDRKCK